MNKNIEPLEVFPWNENFSTGIKIIDEQHQKIISLLNQLAGTLVRDNQLETNRVFDELADYANYHFETEEAIWLEYFKDDSWLSSHQLTHFSFLPKVIELKEQNPNKPMNEVIEGIVRFLIRWLAFHIIDNDKRMAFVIQHIKEGKSLEEAKSISDKKMNGSIRLLIDTVLTMYDSLSSRSLDLMREKHKRHNVEEKLNKTNLRLRKTNAKLKELATTDQLTGLFNRRHFNNVFTRELKRAYRSKSDLSLIILDIDFFKKLNDHYGHSEGDRVLAQVSKKIKSFCKRPTDYAFRLGGEEFGILSADQEPQGLSVFAEIIRKGIEELKIVNTDSDVSDVLTVSIGTVTKVPKGKDTIDDYMFIADMRLYKAKKLGRNRVVSSD